MFKAIKKSIQFGAHTLTLETGEIARQADGAVLVSYGDTAVLVTVVGRHDVKDGQDSLLQLIIKKKHMQQVRSLAVFSNEKAVQVKKRH